MRIEILLVRAEVGEGRGEIVMVRVEAVRGSILEGVKVIIGEGESRDQTLGSKRETVFLISTELLTVTETVKNTLTETVKGTLNLIGTVRDILVSGEIVMNSPIETVRGIRITKDRHLQLRDKGMIGELLQQVVELDSLLQV